MWLTDSQYDCILYCIIIKSCAEVRGMKGIKKPYTKEDDDLIVKILNEYSYNLQQGFRILENNLGRSAQTISVHWYTKLRPAIIKSKTHSFGIAGKEVYGSCKNIHRNKELLVTAKVGINGFFYNSTTSTWYNNFTF